MLTLDIAIATYKPDGIKRVGAMLLPPEDGVRYVVSWQEHENYPIPVELTRREDINVYRCDQKGISNNRNNALTHCTGDIILISDDDIIYKAGAFKSIVESFEKNSSMDFAIFRMKFPKTKNYPEDGSKICLPFPKGYYGSAVEMAFRREKIGELKFWNGIGPGTEFLETGEDEFFLISAIKKGLDIRFIDLEIGEHPSLSSGSKISAGILRGQGYIIRQVYPYSFVLRIPLKAFRLWKHHRISIYKTLIPLFQGSLFVHTVYGAGKKAKSFLYRESRVKKNRTKK